MNQENCPHLRIPASPTDPTTDFAALPLMPCSASSATPENEGYLWMQLEEARRDRERVRAALRDIREGIANEEENGIWEADIILSIIDRALSSEDPSLPNETNPAAGSTLKDNE